MASGTESERLGWGLRLWCTLVGLLLLAPTVVVIPMSFSNADTFQFPPEEWSLRWYRNMFSSSEWVGAFLNSLQVALVVGVLASVLGIAAAFSLDRGRWPGAGMLRAFLMAPMIVPGIVVAIAMYAIFLDWRLTGTLVAFIVAHTVLAIPFVVISVGASLTGFDRDVELASASLGANRVTTWRRVTLPLIMPGVLSGFVFAFVTSFDEVVVSLFIQTPSATTLPVVMYESVTQEIDPTIGAASSLMVVVTTVLLLIPTLARRKERQNWR